MLFCFRFRFSNVCWWGVNFLFRILNLCSGVCFFSILECLLKWLISILALEHLLSVFFNFIFKIKINYFCIWRSTFISVLQRLLVCLVVLFLLEFGTFVKVFQILYYAVFWGFCLENLTIIIIIFDFGYVDKCQCRFGEL